MLTKRAKFILAIALQVMVVFAIIIFKVSVLSGGTDVLLRIEPVDPRDMLRGDYATFRYSNVSNLDSYISDGQPIGNGDTVYVVLRQSGKYWMARNVQKTKPLSGEVALKGKVASGGLATQADVLSDQRLGGSRIHVVYGIEEYFIPEGKGQGFSFFDKEAAARVVVDENGNAVLKQIYVDDKPWP
ncbi:MAG: GDYXXLXY domain-containing protein [bacterium]|nr:GDYXXLXY domain-containing protein [bacterium]